MPDVADYKILKESASSINNVGGSIRIDFDLPPNARLVDGPQRPFLAFSESVSGALPITLSITLNGTTVNVHTHSTLGQHVASRMVIIDGSTFVSGQNSLIFTITGGPGSGAPGTITIQNVIVHFQQQV